MPQYIGIGRYAITPPTYHKDTFVKWWLSWCTKSYCAIDGCTILWGWFITSRAYSGVAIETLLSPPERNKNAQYSERAYTVIEQTCHKTLKLHASPLSYSINNNTMIIKINSGNDFWVFLPLSHLLTLVSVEVHYKLWVHFILCTTTISMLTITELVRQIRFSELYCIALY